MKLFAADALPVSAKSQFVLGRAPSSRGTEQRFLPPGAMMRMSGSPTAHKHAFLSHAIEPIIEALAREAALPSLFAYAARNLADKRASAMPWVRTRIVARNTWSPSALALHREHSDADGRIDRVSESPALAAALEHSSSSPPTKSATA